MPRSPTISRVIELLMQSFRGAACCYHRAIGVALMLLCGCAWAAPAWNTVPPARLFALPDPNIAGESAVALRRARATLMRMEMALCSRNYHGVLVYARGNQLDTLALTHRITDGQVVEQLVSLSGSVRVVVRTPERLVYTQPGKRRLVAAGDSATRLLDSGGIDPYLLRPHYRVVLGTVSRVAGRAAHLVEILPRDNARYGYRFYIDHETSLPLKSDLVDPAGNVLEQLMFTSIELQPSLQVAAKTRKHALRQATPVRYSGDWRFLHQPPGFELVMHHDDSASGGIGQSHGTEHFLFTDRLSSYSIYIESSQGRSGYGGDLAGSASIGAVNAAGRRIGDYQVTVVGEVPLATIQQALDGVVAP